MSLDNEKPCNQKMECEEDPKHDNFKQHRC